MSVTVAMSMTVAVAMAMTMTTVAMKAMNGAAKTTMDRAAIERSVPAGRHLCAGWATAQWHKSRRYGADRRTSHHCQHDAARAFHGTILTAVSGAVTVFVKPCPVASES